MLHKGGTFACATEWNVLRQEQKDLPKEDRDSTGMDLANTFYVNSSGRCTFLTGERLPETGLNNTDHRLHSRNLPGRVAQEEILG